MKTTSSELEKKTTRSWEALTCQVLLGPWVSAAFAYLCGTWRQTFHRGLLLDLQLSRGLCAESSFLHCLDCQVGVLFEGISIHKKTNKRILWILEGAGVQSSLFLRVDHFLMFFPWFHRQSSYSVYGCSHKNLFLHLFVREVFLFFLLLSFLGSFGCFNNWQQGVFFWPQLLLLGCVARRQATSRSWET